MKGGIHAPGELMIRLPHPIIAVRARARAWRLAAGRCCAGPAGRTGRRMVALAAFGLVSALVLAQPLEAQSAEELRRIAEQRLGRPISDEEILTRRRRSGLTPDESRRELESRGYDPSVADSDLEVLEGRATRVSGNADPVPVLEVVTDPAPGSADSATVRTLLEE